MLTEDKVKELFCIADDFCRFFDAMTEKYTQTGMSSEHIEAAENIPLKAP